MRIPAVVLVLSLAPPVVAQATWSVLYPTSPPSHRALALFAGHDASGSCVLLFGLSPATGTVFTEAWRLQGSTWSPIAGVLPPARYASPLVYDAARAELVLFGGQSFGGTTLGDTWIFHGTTWSSPGLGLQPPARFAAGMAFDRVRGVTVLFGGRNAGSPSSLLNDTWEWDGANWQQRLPATSPSARELTLMAFDPVNGGVLLYGGLATVGTASIGLADTWSYDGTNWVQRQTATAPPYRLAAGMVTDLHRQRILLLGGSVGTGGDAFPWEWDGADWHTFYQPNPAPRSDFGIAYDAGARRVVVHGGVIPTGYGSIFLNDTWTYRTPLPASVTAFGSGCAGSAGTPSLANVPYHLPWLGDTVRNRVDHIAAGEFGAVFVSSFGMTPPIDLSFVQMPGCELLVPLDSLDFVVADAGTAEWSLFVPMTPALAGVAWRQQAFPLDAAANPFGLSASNAVEAVFGVR